jgi:hypothetical protein
MTAIIDKDTLHRGVSAVTEALDAIVADEGAALTVLAVALGARVAAFATTERTLNHGLLQLSNSVTRVAVAHFEAKRAET